MVQVVFIFQATDEPIIPVDFSDCFFSVLNSNIIEGEVEEGELRSNNCPATVNSDDLREILMTFR